MSQRRLDALRALAARPGTDHEGQVAREKLARLERKRKQAPNTGTDDDSLYGPLLDPDELNRLLRELAERHQNWPRSDVRWDPSETRCPCGGLYQSGGRCGQTLCHIKICVDLHVTFPIGTRVYYNRLGYAANRPGTVMGHRLPLEGEDWCFMRIQFDDETISRVLRVFSTLGNHISKEPLSESYSRLMRGKV